jgi:hypothetical protein
MHSIIQALSLSLSLSLFLSAGLGYLELIVLIVAFNYSPGNKKNFFFVVEN